MRAVLRRTATFLYQDGAGKQGRHAPRSRVAQSGSSTFACLEGGVIKLVNNPSDGSERAVPNAIAICPREGDLSSTVEDMDVHNNVEL